MYEHCVGFEDLNPRLHESNYTGRCKLSRSLVFRGIEPKASWLGGGAWPGGWAIKPSPLARGHQAVPPAFGSPVW